MKIGGRQASSLVVLAAILFVGLFVPTTTATDSQIKVLVGDVCPNIAGNQPELPTGMQFDADGNCYTPSPPTPPPPSDVCPNLSGNQAAIPTGYYRNKNGSCVAQTKPPQDVCPNVPETQSEVPYGMLTTENGDCVWPPADVCPNIPGPQATMPKGMTYNSSGNCYTPSATPTSGGQKKPPAHKPTINLLPYYFIAAFASVTILLALQAVSESFATRGIIILFKRRKQQTATLQELIARTVEQLKDIVGRLAQSADALVASDTLTNEIITAIKSSTERLQANVTSTSAFEAGDLALEDHDAFSRKGIHVKTLVSPLFLAPVLVTTIAVILANILLGESAPIAFGAWHIWLQVTALLVLAMLLFLILRTRHVRHIQHQHVEQLISNVDNLSSAEGEFLHQLHIVLDVGVHDLDTYKESVSDDAFITPLSELAIINDKLGAFADDTITLESLTHLLGEPQDQTVQSHNRQVH